MPLHAAGDYSSNASPGTKLCDYAISSYTPSVNALLEAFNASSSLGPVHTAPQLLAISQSYDLPGTVEELNFIKSQARDVVSVKTLVGSEATIEEVKEQMKKSDWVHFACHGVQDGKQSLESALILAGSSHLTLSDIMTMNLQTKSLAFLSACQTATGDADLTEEAIHLAAGMLSAGYRGVLATMWSISDELSPQVVNDIYRFLFKDGKPNAERAAEALHHAIKNIQEKASFKDWVPFIHVGL